MVLHRTHRYLGISCAFFALLLAITGLILLRSDSWNLAQTKPPASLIRSLYDLPIPKLTSYKIAEDWWSFSETMLWKNNTLAIEHCSEPIQIFKLEFGTCVINADELILLDPNAKLIDRIDSKNGLPLKTPLIAAMFKDNSLLLKNDHESMESSDFLNWTSTERSISFKPLNSTATPPTLLNDLLKQNSPDSISWERVMLDLHSGRLLGKFGPWMMELSAWGLILLTLSGCYLQFQRNRLMRKPR